MKSQTTKGDPKEKIMSYKFNILHINTHIFTQATDVIIRYIN